MLRTMERKRQKRVRLMVKAKIRIKNPTGLHLRPAGILCNEAARHDCSITFRYRDTISNAKSVLSVLGACIKCGDEIEFICEGKGEEEALSAMLKVVEDGLGE